MASWRGKRPTQSTTTTLLNSGGAGASIALTPGSVDGPRSISKRETECYYVRHSRWRSQYIGVTRCGWRKNMHACVSVLNAWMCQRIVLSTWSANYFLKKKMRLFRRKWASLVLHADSSFRRMWASDELYILDRFTYIHTKKSFVQTLLMSIVSFKTDCSETAAASQLWDSGREQWGCQ